MFIIEERDKEIHRDIKVRAYYLWLNDYICNKFVNKPEYYWFKAEKIELSYTFYASNCSVDSLDDESFEIVKLV